MGSEIVGIGSAVVNHLTIVTRTDGWEDLGKPFTQGGGIVATACVAAARLGASVEMWTAVGNDYHGQMIVNEFAAQGVCIDQIRVLPGLRSWCTFVEVDSKTGDRAFFGAGDRDLREAELSFDFSRLRGVKALLLQERLVDTAIAAARIARAEGAVVVTDAFGVEGAIAELIALTDALIVPEWTGEAIAGSRDFALALRKMLDLGPRMPAITLGREGCVYWADGAAWHCPAFPIQVVDTTGCGDTFHGAFAFAMTRGYDVHEAIRLSSAASAMKATKLGGRSGIPTLAALQAFLADRPGHGRARRLQF